MLKLCSRIVFFRKEIKLYSFDYVCEIEIQTSWELLTQTAKVEIPNSFKEISEYASKKILIGDEIEIHLGYIKDNINKKVGTDMVRKFKGYVTKIKPGAVVKLECEDEMWKLKNTVINGYIHESPITFKTLIGELKRKTASKFISNIEDTSDLGKIVIDPGASFADVLEMLKSKYLFLIYFRHGVLNIKRPIKFNGNPVKTFIVQRNIIGADSLDYQEEKDVKLMVKMTTQTLTDGESDKKKTVYVYYNSEGRLTHAEMPAVGYNQIEHTVIAKGEANVNQMISQAKEIIDAQTYTGYKGTFDTFGEPSINFGDFAYIEDFKYPERSSRKGSPYLIRSVSYTFGKNGYHEKVGIYGISSK